MTDFDPGDLELSEDELLERLGNELLGGGRGISPEDADKKRRFASRWLAQWLEENRDALCSHPAVVSLLADESARSTAEELAVIVDVLSPLLASPPVMTVALIIVKRGLERLCGQSGGSGL